jgi:hypothetical protein
MPVNALAARPHPDCPLVVAYGLGVDSTALLVEFARRGIRPDLILFADTGGEKPETYQYLHVIRPFLARAGFPAVAVVRYRPTRAAYATLEAQCLHTGTLPSLAYGGRSCSIKYKKVPQDRYVAGWAPARACWARGGKVVKAIGFDAGPADSRRHRYVEDQRFTYWYPLVEWGYDRDRCRHLIQAAGLPVPPSPRASTVRPARRRRSPGWRSTTRTCSDAHCGSSGTPGPSCGRSGAWAGRSPGRTSWPAAPTCPCSTGTVESLRSFASQAPSSPAALAKVGGCDG